MSFLKRESKNVDGIDMIVKKKPLDVTSPVGILNKLSIDRMQQWQSEHHLDEKLKESLRHVKKNSLGKESYISFYFLPPIVYLFRWSLTL